jgi:hypothetical protein
MKIGQETLSQKPLQPPRPNKPRNCFPFNIVVMDIKKNICMSAALCSQYGATTVAAESLIAQLHSQGKLTTPRRENRKIRHEIEIVKAKNPLNF